MFLYIVRRTIMLIPILILMSMVAFFLIQLPPGDYVSFRIQQMKMSGVTVSDNDAELLKREFGLDQPAPVRYWRWVSGIVTKGYWGRSLQWNKPVHEILNERVPMTIMLSFFSLVVSWAIALPLGIISATRQYSVVDYIITFIGFIGIATPGFLLALILAYIVFANTGFSVLGLFSSDYMDVPWSLARVGDLLKHLWMPLVLIGLGNTGGTIRVVRNNLLDELHKQYVITARAKGLTEWNLMIKYPVRMAINPLLSTIGW
ncbi:MAG: ABC transporter permease, partial [Anaerolineaceae bacterium]|nr:ABC transporter permease [Anaerolineaceae bacterium]